MEKIQKINFYNNQENTQYHPSRNRPKKIDSNNKIY